ncbi:deoxynucleoside kinase, partial [Acinetobacter baumannii]|nr:deoxynucleoside kinase [Acinetobacter baumannii]
MQVAIAGNIGAGKTTLTQLLAKHYKWTPHFEDVVDNPYLDDFYHQMERWSFNLQVYFLNSRFRQILRMRESGKNTIQDRTIYEDAYIFAPNLHDMGLMSGRDFKNYKSLFELMEELIGAPDLLIYLRSSIPNLVSQIHKRGREYENSISIDYLSKLNERYESWAKSYDKGKILIVRDQFETVRLPLREICPIDLVPAQEQRLPGKISRSGIQQPYAERLQALQEAQAVYEGLVDAAYDMDKAIPNERLALFDRLWFSQGETGPFVNARRAWRRLETDLERWGEELESEAVALCQEVLGIEVGDIVLVEFGKNTVRLQVEGMNVYSSDERVMFGVWGTRFRKGGLP